MTCWIKAGNYIRDDVVACTIQLISETQPQQGYAVNALWHALERDTFDKQPLAQVATWCIGEYGDLLLYGPPPEDMEAPVNVNINDLSKFSEFHTYVIYERHSSVKSHKSTKYFRKVYNF